MGAGLESRKLTISNVELFSTWVPVNVPRFGYLVCLLVVYEYSGWACTLKEPIEGGLMLRVSEKFLGKKLDI